MRALRGITIVALTALTVTFASTAAVPTEPDEGAIASLVPGSSASYVAWPATHQGYTGHWTGADAVSAPSGATTVELRLPDEVLELPPPPVSVWVHAISGVDSVEVAQWVDNLASGSISFDLQAAISTAASLGMPSVDSLEVYAETGFHPTHSLDLLIGVLLVDGTPGQPCVIDLGVPPSKSHAQLYSASGVRIAPGGRITMLAWPGFFSDAPQPLEAFLFRADHGVSVDLTSSMTISADGSALSVVVPSDVASYAWLDIWAGVSAPAPTYRYSVTAALLAPSTDAVEAYVTAVYNDLFGRDPDPAGLNGWTYALRHGAPYSAVADSITASAEFRAGLITDAYWAYLGRGPDPAGLAGWLRAMNQGMHIQQMEAGFLASKEYYDVRGGGTDAGWIKALYGDVLGRAPSPTEVSAWLPVIKNAGRQVIAFGFLYSTEKLATDVEGYYQWLLRRGLDPVGRNGWVKAIQGGVRVEVIIAGIIASQEYRNNVPVG